jgi:hypothetical protein
MEGISLGREGVTANTFAQFELKEGIFTNISDGAPKQADIYAYLLKRKNS